MPGQHSDEERERKERIKKLKAKTSKMRLAIVKKKSSVYGDYLTPKEAKPAYKELFKKNNITNPKEFNDYADKNKKVLEKAKLPGKDYLSVYSLDNAKKYKSSALESTGKQRKELSKDQSDLAYEYEVATPKQKKQLDKHLKKINFKAKP